MSVNHQPVQIAFNQFFPDQLAVYRIGNQEKTAIGKPSLLHQHFNNPASNTDHAQLMHEIAGYLKDKENGAVYSFFAKYINEDLPEAAWQLSCCRLNKDKNEQPAEVVVFTYDLELPGEAKTRLYHLLEEDSLFKANFDKAAKLTKREKEIIGLLAKGMSSKQIAGISYTSVHTVNTHRQHIKKKLAIQNLPDLLRFAAVFNLSDNSTNI